MPKHNMTGPYRLIACRDSCASVRRHGFLGTLVFPRRMIGSASCRPPPGLRPTDQPDDQYAARHEDRLKGQQIGFHIGSSSLRGSTTVSLSDHAVMGDPMTVDSRDGCRTIGSTDFGRAPLSCSGGHRRFSPASMRRLREEISSRLPAGPSLMSIPSFSLAGWTGQPPEMVPSPLCARLQFRPDFCRHISDGIRACRSAGADLGEMILHHFSR